MEKLTWTRLSNSTTPMPTIDDDIKCVLSNVSGSACSHHKPMNKELGYVAWHEWAERKTKQGHIQKQCPDCGRWYFNRIEMTKQEKIKRIVEIRKSIAELKQLKKDVKGRDNSKRLKNSNMIEWAKECLDNSAWVESRLRTLDHYIKEAETRIEELKLELEFA